jgi:5-methylcytosine-specific restriction endonuclease McrA
MPSVIAMKAMKRNGKSFPKYGKSWGKMRKGILRCKNHLI